MKRVFILANNHKLDHHHIKKLNINDDDIFFLFNQMYHSYDICKRYLNQKIVFLRGLEDDLLKQCGDFYLGGKNFTNIQSDFIKVVLIWKIYQEFADNINIPYELLDIETFLLDFNIEYPRLSPTSGFLAYLYAKKIYKEYEIILVGFSGKLPDGSDPIKMITHDYKWEQSYYIKNKVETIILDDIIDFEV
jgi:hypothetical protein